MDHPAKFHSLSSRGAELIANGSPWDKLSQILANPYQPESNPDGFVNLGTAENVGLPSVPEDLMRERN